MSERDDGGSAFARITEIMTPNTVDHQSPKWSRVRSDPGMSLRDWFAGQALAGLLSSNATYEGKTNNYSAITADAFAHADAMLEARK